MASLVCTAGPSNGQSFPLGDKPLVSFGREDDCTYQLLDPAVSRHHLQVGAIPPSGGGIGGGGHYAADYRTSNGTFINGSRIEGKVPLKDGDSITIGGTTLVYQKADTAPAAGAAAAKKKPDAWAIDTIAPPGPGRSR